MVELPEKTRPRLYLIDGYALIYRAFYAMISRPLMTSKGENTSAAFGLTRFLLKLLDDYAPDYLGVVMDAGTSARTEVYPEYKATREKMPDELRASLPRIRELVEAFRIPILELEDHEADDVIGTMARLAADAGVETVIVSGDKDFYQLIDDDVKLLNPGRGGQANVDEEWVGPANASERLGVPPGRVRDYLALIGDSSDNIPGAKGIGPKTAVKLIDEYGPVEEILDHAGEVSGKRAREALQEYEEQIRLSKQLVTIIRDLPVQLDLEALEVTGPDRDRLKELFATLEFHGLVREIAAPEPETRKLESDYRVVASADGVRDLAARIRDRGAEGFYAGETARLLVAEMERGGGIITLEDLARYEAVERTPVTGSYRGYGVIGMPPPSSGGTILVEMLNILEGYDLAALGHNTAPYLHRLAEAMRRGYLDRARWIADPDFEDVPVARLTSKAYAAGLRAGIREETATPSSVEDAALVGEGTETTHFSVVDAEGMAVSTTYTLEYSYGSRITVPGAGFLLNNEMGDFNAAPGLTTEDGLIGTEANLAEPEKRMLSSMTPTILTDPEGRLFALVGSPGGRRIINIVLQATLNLVDFDMGVLEAVQASRAHHQWLPDELDLEDGGWPDPVLAGLRSRGHTLDLADPFGHIHAIRVAPDGRLMGAPDPRDPDAAAVGH